MSDSFGTSIADIGALSGLLQESKDAMDNRQYNQKPTSTAPTVVKRGESSENSAVKPQISSPKNDTIWQEEEIPTEDKLLDVKDGRPAPRYEFTYKQSVGTEDTFLGLGDKTPLTQDCTHIVIKIHFPGATMKQLDLEVKKNRLLAVSKTHRLFTYLPVNVDDANGKAAFDTKKEVLTITLPIIPEF